MKPVHHISCFLFRSSGAREEGRAVIKIPILQAGGLMHRIFPQTTSGPRSSEPPWPGHACPAAPSQLPSATPASSTQPSPFASTFTLGLRTVSSISQMKKLMPNQLRTPGLIVGDRPHWTGARIPWPHGPAPPPPSLRAFLLCQHPFPAQVVVFTFRAAESPHFPPQPQKHLELQKTL